MKKVLGAGFWVLVYAAAARGQGFTQRGFLETDFIGYPQTAPNDSGQAIGEALFQYEAFYKLSSDWQFAGGIDLRADTHQQVERDWNFSWDDRQLRRPGDRGAAAQCDLFEEQAHRGPGQTVYPLGQGRPAESYGPLRAARFPDSGGQRFSGHHGGAGDLWRAVQYHRTGLVAAVYPEPCPADRPALDRAAGGVRGWCCAR